MERIQQVQQVVNDMLARLKHEEWKRDGYTHLYGGVR